MALRVWLPLNGNINNYGISDVTVTNNGATVDNNGKIGKCYSFGSSKRITASKPNNLSTSSASLSCWVNLSSWGSSYDSLVNLSTGTGWNDTRLALVRNNTANRIGFCIANGSTYNYVVMTSDLPLNKWTHLAGTFDGSTIKIYINGILNNSLSTTFSSLVYGSPVLNLGSWSNGNNYPINGKLNDVRLYDHCLSAKEVKELAKGLVLHYKLAGPGQANLLTNSLDLSKWDNPNGKSELQSDNFYKATYTGGGWWGPRKAVNLTAGKTYIASCMARGTRSQLWFYHNVSGGNNAGSAIVNTNKATKLTVVFTPTVTGSYYIVGYAANDNNTYFYKDMKLEEGSIATPWCPNPTDPLYSALGYNSNIEDDCSGYLYNGTKSGTITWDADSPRYSTSYKFNNGKIVSSYSSVGLTNATMAAWVNPSSYHSERSCIMIGGIYLTVDSSGKLSGYAYGKNPAGYHTGKTTIPLNTWTHIALVWNDTHLIGYVNGIEDFRVACTGTFNTSTNIQVGMENSGRVFSGKLSDARIYATALSESDIKELYNTPLSIDNVGNMYTYDFEEI